MARIKLTLPIQSPNFVCEIPVRITDINYGGHLGNDSMVSLLHQARMLFLDSLGYSEMDIEGVALIQGDLAVTYKGESFFNDVLRFEIYVSDMSHRSFDLYYNITTIRDDKEESIAIAKTGVVCFDYDSRKSCAVPEAFAERFA